MSRNVVKLFGDVVRENHRWQQPIIKWSLVDDLAMMVPCREFLSCQMKCGNQNEMKNNILVDVIKIRKNQELNANKSINLEINNHNVLTRKLEQFVILTKSG